MSDTVKIQNDNSIGNDNITGMFQFGKRVKKDEEFYYTDESLLNAYRNFINGKPVKMIYCDEQGFHPTKPEYYTYGKTN